MHATQGIYSFWSLAALAREGLVDRHMDQSQGTLVPLRGRGLCPPQSCSSLPGLQKDEPGLGPTNQPGPYGRGWLHLSRPLRPSLHPALAGPEGLMF